MINKTNTNFKKKIRQALKKVIDPEFGVNIVDLGLIYKISVKSCKANIVMTLTSPGCPLSYMFEELITKSLSKVRGLSKVKITLTFDPIWTPDKMSKEAKLKIRF